MASLKKPSIYSDRGNIGSADELDEYGVWVKSGPQILPKTNDNVSSLQADNFTETDDSAAFSDAVLDINADGISDFDDIDFPDDDIDIDTIDNKESADSDLGEYSFKEETAGETGKTGINIEDANFEDFDTSFETEESEEAEKTETEEGGASGENLIDDNFDINIDDIPDETQTNFDEDININIEIDDITDSNFVRGVSIKNNLNNDSGDDPDSESFDLDAEIKIDADFGESNSEIVDLDADIKIGADSSESDSEVVDLNADIKIEADSSDSDSDSFDLDADINIDVESVPLNIDIDDNMKIEAETDDAGSVSIDLNDEPLADEDDFATDESGFADIDTLDIPTVKSIENNDSRLNVNYDTAGGGDLSSLLLQKIANELSSIRNELTDLKKEFAIARSGIKEAAKPEPAAENEDSPRSGGFFSEEDDETISLTGDELNNILATGESVEEQGIPETLDDEDIIQDISIDEGPFDDDDEIIALTGDEMENILNSADFTEESGTNETPENIFSDDTDVLSANIDIEMPADDDIEIDEEVFTDEEFDPASEESIITTAGESTDEMTDVSMDLEIDLPDDSDIDSLDTDHNTAAFDSTDIDTEDFDTPNDAAGLLDENIDIALDDAALDENIDPVTDEETLDNNIEITLDEETLDDTAETESVEETLGDSVETAADEKTRDDSLDLMLEKMDNNIEAAADEETEDDNGDLILDEVPDDSVDLSFDDEIPDDSIDLILNEALDAADALDNEADTSDTVDLSLDDIPEETLDDTVDTSDTIDLSLDDIAEDTLDDTVDTSDAIDLSLDDIAEEALDDTVDTSDAIDLSLDDIAEEAPEESVDTSDTVDLLLGDNADEAFEENAIDDTPSAEEPLDDNIESLFDDDLLLDEVPEEDLDLTLDDDIDETPGDETFNVDHELELLREEGVLPVTELPENASYLEDSDVVEDLDLSDAVIDEPELSADSIKDDLTEPVIDESEYNLDDLDDLIINTEPEEETVSPDEPAEAEAETTFEDVEITNEITEPEEKAESLPPDFETEDLKETSAAQAAVIQTQPRDTNLVTAAAKQSAAQEKRKESFQLPSGLKSELRNILSYMDQLLDSLPEEKIEEFAKSNYYDSYKKLFKDLGLV